MRPLLLVICLAAMACQPAPEQSGSSLAARSRGLTQPVSGILVVDELGGTLFPCSGEAAQRLADPASLLRADSATTVAGNSFWIQGQAAGQGDTLWLEQLSSLSASWWEAPCPLVKAIQGLGNEPGWELRIDPPKTILLRTQYGMVEAEFPFILPARQGSSWVYDITVNTGRRPDRLQISWEESPCQDNMAGNDFPFQVNVQWNDTLLSGCGRPLPPAKPVRK